MIIKSNNVYKVNAKRTEHPYQYVVTYVKAASIEDVINILKKSYNFSYFTIKEIVSLGNIIEEVE